MIPFVKWYEKKLKYLIIGVSLLNVRTGWINMYANIQVLVLFTYMMNVLWIHLLFLPLSHTYNGLYMVLTIGFSIALLIPYGRVMYDIFHRRIFHSDEATKYAERFARRVAVSNRQQMCSLVLLGFHPIVILFFLLILGRLLL